LHGVAAIDESTQDTGVSQEQLLPFLNPTPHSHSHVVSIVFNQIPDDIK
jgi:hypothetical protein